MRVSLALSWTASSVILRSHVTDAQKRQLGHNCFNRRSMHGACDVDLNDGEEMACLEINGYFQCAPARREGDRCGVGNRYNECRQGLTCTGAGGECRTAPAIGEECAASVSFDARNVCGFQGFCEPDDFSCREYITTTVDFEDPCTPDTNYGYRECAANLTCEYHYNNGDAYGTCVPRMQENERSCGDQDCADGLMCYDWTCVPLSHRGERCKKQYDCIGNLICAFATNTCELRSESDATVIDIVPTRAPTTEPTNRPTLPPSIDIVPTRAPTMDPTSRPALPPSTTTTHPTTFSSAPPVIQLPNNQEPETEDPAPSPLPTEPQISLLAAIVGVVGSFLGLVTAVLGIIHWKRLHASPGGGQGQGGGPGGGAVQMQPVGANAVAAVGVNP